jgi:hydroxymethylbilane synthase
VVDRQRSRQLTGQFVAEPASHQPDLQPPHRLRLATRESRLALWQANHVADLLKARYPQCAVGIVGMTTRGDQIQDRPLSEIGGKGLFTKELELALIDGRAELAVHSLKDVPMELPESFELACMLQRADPRDAFISNEYEELAQMPPGTTVGPRVSDARRNFASTFPSCESSRCAATSTPDWASWTAAATMRSSWPPPASSAWGWRPGSGR